MSKVAEAPAVPDELDESIAELCLTQGISEDKLYSAAHTIEQLDLFQAMLVECSVVQYFPNLTQVIIIQCPRVVALEGFESCTVLEELYISECRIKRIESLQRCTKLRKLCLDGNQIEAIENLDKLTGLEELMLNDNKIAELQGLERLKRLRVFSVARNFIERIGTALDELAALEDLNLSDNRVGYFKEIHNLTRLPALKTLCFNEPHYGDNPVCNLCNYQTYVLYQLNSLKCLDTLHVSDEAKALAEATYIKKKMYYNMRIKTLKRNTTNVIRRAAEALQARVGQINLNFNVLLRQLKEVQRLVEEREFVESKGADSVGAYSAPSDASLSFWSALERKHEVLNGSIQQRADEVSDIEGRFLALKDRLVLISQQNIDRMLVELGTGGNIRLEDGKPSDVWYSSCVELLHSRFFARDFANLGVKGVKVHRVTRVHNRFLRNRFDSKMSTVLSRNARLTRGSGVPSKPPRRSLEYLFFSVPGMSMKSSTVAAGELQRIAQEGFSTTDHADSLAPVCGLPPYAFKPVKVSYAAGNRKHAKRVAGEMMKVAEKERAQLIEMQLAGRPAEGIPLTNSLSIADMPRLCNCVESVMEATGSYSPATSATRALESQDVELLSKAVHGTDHKAAAVAAASATRAARGAHMPAVGLEQKPSTWMADAGLDLSTMSAKLVLEGLRSQGVAHKPGAPTRPKGPKDLKFVARGLRSPEVSEGVVMIAKVFLGNCQLLDERTGLPVDSVKTEEEDDDAVDDDVIDSDKDVRHSVCRARSDDPKQRLWLALAPELVLPEYIIEYEYEWDGDKAASSTAATMTSELGALADLSAGVSGSGSGSGSSSSAAIRLTPQAEADLRPLARPLASFVNDCRNAMRRAGEAPAVAAAATAAATAAAAEAASAEAAGDAGEEGAAAAAGAGAAAAAAGAGAGADGAGAFVMQALDLPPTLSPRPKVSIMDEASILGASPGASLATLQYLNLHGNNIKVIEGLASCAALRVLVLTFNEISRIEGLTTLVQLERLELGFNLIKRVEGLRGLARLRTLELNNNLLYQLEDIRELRRDVPSLTSLNLRNNGLCDSKGYRSVVLGKLPRLEVLDGRPLNDDDRLTAEAAATAITPALIKRHSRTSTGAPVAAPGEASGGGSGAGAGAGAGTDEAKGADGADGGGAADWGADGGAWCSTVESLDLSHMRLRRINNLDRVTRVRRLDLADNELTAIEGLEALAVLEELNLEENRIARLEGLAGLRFLKKLDLGKNRLTKVEGISSLVQLSQLSLEDNELASLEGIGRLPSLMELYIGNNKITSIKEVLFLKELPKLIILDLSGNPLCSHETYRLYTIYHLRRLKVLDGVGVDSTEQGAARERYSGRLTAEFLEEKIGHAYFEAIRELDLASCRIREIEGLSGDTFRCLSYLNLDHNHLTGTGLGGLTALPHLSVLRLNHNRLSDLLPGCVGVGERGTGTDVPPGQPGGTVGSLARLEVLQLGFNQISDISALGLHRLPALKVLYLQGNDIARVSGLETCGSLRELVLDKNRVKYLDPTSFAGLTSLCDLRIQENGLRSLSHLHYLVSLQVLALSFNRISDLPELDKLGCLPSLGELWLANNPVARKQLYRPGLIKRLPSLRILDGREILVDERERAELLFSTDPRPSPMYIQDTRPMPGRVPVRLTSVNFESLTGYNRDGGAQPLMATGIGGHTDDYRAQYHAQFAGGGGGGDRASYPLPQPTYLAPGGVGVTGSALGVGSGAGGAGAGGSASAAAAAQANYVDSLLMPLARQPPQARGSGGGGRSGRPGRDASPLGFDRGGRRTGKPGHGDYKASRGGRTAYNARTNGRTTGGGRGASPRYFGRR